MPANICTMLFSQLSLYKLRRAMRERRRPQAPLPVPRSGADLVSSAYLKQHWRRACSPLP